MTFETPKILNGAVNFEKFYSLLRKEKNPFVLKILYFLYDLYYGMTVSEASKKHKITNETGYKYAKIWRNEGIEGLIPNYSDGRPSKMTENQEIIVKNKIKQGKIHSTDELINFILENFEIDYSQSWAYELFKELSLKDGIKYPLPKKENKSKKKVFKRKKTSMKIFLNDDGLECLKVSKKLYFIRYDDINRLKDLIDSEKDNRLLKRYLFINSLNNGFNIEETYNVLNISISTARLWLKMWNQSGLNGLKIEWGGGRPNFLTDEQQKQVMDYIRNNHVTRHSEIHKFILEEFNVNYSLNHLYRFVKKKLKFNYSKPLSNIS
jgi:transposase